MDIPWAPSASFRFSLLSPLFPLPFSFLFLSFFFLLLPLFPPPPLSRGWISTPGRGLTPPCRCLWALATGLCAVRCAVVSPAQASTAS